MDEARLAGEFERAMRESCHEATGLGYYPIRFLQTLTERGALPYARELVRGAEIQSGLKRLHRLNRLDLSIEHLIANEERFRSLFTDEERDAARWRLEQAAARR